MQALVSLDQAPPISVPLRFFLTAPLFTVLAALVMLATGPELWASRWTPAALAVTHLITAGFMLQTMLGALQQLMPVVMGVQMARPRLVAGAVHTSLTLGVLCLAGGFLSASGPGYALAAGLLGLGVLVFVVASIHAMWGLPPAAPVATGLRLALAALLLAAGLGVWMTLSLAGLHTMALPLQQMANVHLSWGLIGWSSTLLGAIALVVVPMFQMTPGYPAWFGRWFGRAALSFVSLWSAAEWQHWALTSTWLGAAVVSMGLCLAGTTLWVLRRSRRAVRDAVARLWQVAMLSAVAACVVWLVGSLLPELADAGAWPLLVGVLALLGGFLSVMTGMLYKIVPFLIWMHLQEQGAGRVMAPNIKKVLAQRPIDQQTRSHWASLVLLVLAACWPQWFSYTGALALLVSQIWLTRNLWSAAKLYRQHSARLQTPSAGAGQAPE
jgi:hypothetical protein